jgi:hypothetical protein
MAPNVARALLVLLYPLRRYAAMTLPPAAGGPARIRFVSGSRANQERSLSARAHQAERPPLAEA